MQKLLWEIVLETLKPSLAVKLEKRKSLWFMLFTCRAQTQVIKRFEVSLCRLIGVGGWTYPADLCQSHCCSVATYESKYENHINMEKLSALRNSGNCFRENNVILMYFLEGLKWIPQGSI